MAENSGTVAPANVVQWLEEEQQQQKAAVFKMQQQLEQQQNTLWTLGNRLSSLEAALNTVMSHGARVATLEEGLRLTQEMLERMQSDAEEQQQQEASAERERQAALERERQVRIDALQKQETWEREKAAILERVQAVEESGRRRQEELFQLSQTLNSLQNRDEDIVAQLSGQQSHAKRLTEELAETRQEQQTLHAQEEVLQGRMQHLSELVRRLESETSLHDMESRITQALGEQNELQRLERQRLDRALGEAQLANEQYKSTVEDLRQLVIQLQGKSQALTDHMDHLRDQLWQLRTDLAEQFTAIRTNEEQQRRRAVADLEQQIKELGAWAPRPPRS